MTRENEIFESLKSNPDVFISACIESMYDAHLLRGMPPKNAELRHAILSRDYVVLGLILLDSASECLRQQAADQAADEADAQVLA